MSSKKKGSNNNRQQQQAQQKKPVESAAASPAEIIASPAPTIVVKPASEILTTADGEQLLNESIAEVDAYVEGKRKAADTYYDEKVADADKYYDDKKAEADKLEGEAQASIEAAVGKAVKEKEDSMKEQLEEAEKRASSIVSDAEKIAAEKTQGLAEREKALDARGEKYTKDFAELEARKVTYKDEVQQGIMDELSAITADRDRLEKQVEEIKRSERKHVSEIAGLEEDKEFYESQLGETSVKRSEILAYQMKIEGLERDNETINKLYKELQETAERLKAQILLYGDNPSRAIEENAELRKKIAELNDLIANCPSAEELKTLREMRTHYEQLSNKIEIVESEKAKLEAENIDLRVSKDEIEACRRFIKILELQKEELRHELDRNIELYNNSTELVFASLSEIDKIKVNEYPSMLGKITLKDLCTKFRGYLANRPNKPLYYDEETIRTFIAGFASSRLMILEGLSGTGKSSLPTAFADFMGSKTIKVEVQSSWKDRNDLLGFYNDFKKQYKETKFLKALYTATHDPNNIYIIVLDEMNLSRIEYYFADLLSVLEESNVEDWQLELISDYASVTKNAEAWPALIHDGKLQICDNTWFVGTANKDDSTFIITDKVYDRATVLNFDRRGEKGKADAATPIKMNNSDFQALLTNASKFKDEADRKKYQEMIKYLDKQIKDMFEITFGNRIEMQLEKFVPVYVACGGTVDEAVDIMFSRKVLRKLEGVYDENTKENLELFKEEILDRYVMPFTIAAIEKIVDRI